jgi:PAS domain S-box-containing protein
MVLLRGLADPWLGDALPVATVYGAVAAAVWCGGYRPALLAAALGFLACNYLFMKPRGELSLLRPPDLVGIALYLFTCTMVIGFGEAMRRAHTRDREARELLRVTFESMGDAVITTDAGGRVTSLNPASEALTGWTLKEAEGQPLDAVFQIASGNPGQPVENAVRELLAGGRIVALAHQTGLISRSAAVRPVEGSAAPIRDADGVLRGLVVVFRDAAGRRQFEESLREADRRKDEFLATLAHELRNPLAPVRNAVEILKAIGSGDRTVARTVEMMDRQLGHLVRLVDDLLDVSRIARGKLDLRPERVALADVVNAAVEATLPMITRQGHELAVEPVPRVFLRADPTRLAQVVSNLLTNAARYTERGGRIAVSARRDGGEVVLAVRDNGIGIPPAMLTRVFEMFGQVERGPGRAAGGLGIGLALVKALVEMHGGAVEARSDGEGKGSEFVVRLPVPPDEAAG